MDFYYMIRNLDEEQIKELISLKIDQARYNARVFPNRFIGVNCGVNPSISLAGEEEQDSQTLWQGFIPEDVKIIYSFEKDEKGYTSNRGRYYYMDSHDYIYEFAKYIKDKELISEFEFLTYLQIFMDNYFRGMTSNNQTRFQMHQPLYDHNGRYIEPIVKHHFSDFKGANNAKCSEYSAMAENILSIFGYKVMYLGGSVKTPYSKGGHIFNFTIVDGNPCVVDFTIPVELYSLEGSKKIYSPFLGYIENYSIENLKKHILEREPFSFPEYYYLLGDQQISCVPYNEERNYVVGNVEYYNNNHTLHKKNK